MVIPYDFIQLLMILCNVAGESTSLTISKKWPKVAMTWMETSPSSGIAILPLRDIPDDSDDDSDDESNDASAAIIIGPGLSRGPEVDVLSAASPPGMS